MCDQQTTEICDNLAAQANELRIAEQHEATIVAALALPLSHRLRLWLDLGAQFVCVYCGVPATNLNGWGQPACATHKSAYTGPLD